VLATAQPCALEADRSAVSAAPGSSVPLPEPFELCPRRILVVEDDKVTATLLHHRLVRDGYEVKDFLNGEDALDWALQEPFDLAILDVKVPGMDGFELLERLRRIERLADVPIVMLTGMGRESDVIRGLELGANDYMLKPFSPTELLARVRRLLLDAPIGAQNGSQTGEARAP
jgi:two-component system phosphate regulon response regulator PhoB